MLTRKSATLCATACLLAASSAAAVALTPIESLGKAIFFDSNLSINKNQSCASCHDPAVGWTGPLSDLNADGAVYEGSVAGRFGNRKPPSAAYATPSPVLYLVVDKKEALFIGGNFWDGRATGEKLGNPAADQAQGPFLNPLEQALPDPAAVVSRICASTYSGQFSQVCGTGACNTESVNRAYDCVGLTVAAYEGSSEVNRYSSKYDDYLAGAADLTKQEKLGLNLFKSKGNCANCHLIDQGPDGEPPLFTDFTYDNLGVPRNPENPFYVEPGFNSQGFSWIDLGLGGYLNSREDYQEYADDNYGKVKVPTLRNVDKRPYEVFVKAYGHNGYFKSLEQIVHFYNTRDAKPPCLNDFTPVEDAISQNCWPRPEVPVNVNTKELGNLHLTQEQEDAIVAFLKTLTDSD